MNTLSDNSRPNTPRFNGWSAVILLAFVCTSVGWCVDRTHLTKQVRRWSEQAQSCKAQFPEPSVHARLVHEQAYFGKAQILEYMLNNDTLGKPIPDYPPVRQLADGTFDESQLPVLWERAQSRHPGGKCVGYYFSLDKQGKVDRDLRGPAFFVLTIDGKVAWIQDTVLW